MTNRTWVGGDSNDSVYDPKNWSPKGMPQSGDTLSFVSGTASVRGGDLAGDPLLMGYVASPYPNMPQSVSPVLNVSGGASVSVAADSFYVDNYSTINVSGRNTVNVAAQASTHSGFANVQVNVRGGVMTGALDTYNAAITIDGPGKFSNTNSALEIGNVTINSDMIGTGTTSLSFVHLELGGRVSQGQTFTFAAPTSSLTIDHPRQFHGTIVEPTNSPATSDEQVNLLGLHADSYSLTNDLLTLYDEGKAIDHVAFHSTSGATTFVGQGSAGVVIGINETAPAGVTPLQLHGTV